MVLGGLSCREYETTAETVPEVVPEAFGLAKLSVSHRFIRANTREYARIRVNSAGSKNGGSTMRSDWC